MHYMNNALTVHLCLRLLPREIRPDGAGVNMVEAGPDTGDVHLDSELLADLQHLPTVLAEEVPAVCAVGIIPFISQARGGGARDAPGTTDD